MHRRSIIALILLLTAISGTADDSATDLSIESDDSTLKVTTIRRSYHHNGREVVPGIFVASSVTADVKTCTDLVVRITSLHADSWAPRDRVDCR